MARPNLFAQLKTVFQRPVVIRNVGGRKLKVADSSHIQAFSTNALRDRYSRIFVSSAYSSPLSSGYGQNAAYQAQRIMLFRDYDLMDNDPVISSALDIFADESTVPNEYGKILVVSSEDVKIKEIVENLFYDILNIEHNLYWWIRSAVKYGDFFLFLEISEKFGVVNCLPLSVYDTIRIEGEKPENPSYFYFETLGANGHKQKFDNYEIAHFRMLSDGNFLPYGKSLIEPARRIFRQLTLMEDAMLIHRIMRAPEKRIFKIDVGAIAPDAVEPTIKMMMDRSKKIPFIDPATGDYNLRYNMQNIMEDFWIPVRGGDSGTEITNLQGLQYDSIEDIEYLQNKLFAALKIPKAFLGYDESINGKLTLAAEDVRFARTIAKIQRPIVSELKRIAQIHLFAQGFRDEQMMNFELELVNPSTIFEQEKVNLWTEKINLATSMMTSNLLSSDFIYHEIFKMPDEQVAEERAKVILDKKRLAKLQQIETGQDQQGAPPMDGGGDMPPDDMPPPEGGDMPLPEGAEDEPDLGGRPEKGQTYAQDSHVRGRDPLGFKERYQALHRANDRVSSKSPFSLDLSRMEARFSGKQNSELMTENSDFSVTDDLKGTYMDPDNL